MKIRRTTEIYEHTLTANAQGKDKITSLQIDDLFLYKIQVIRPDTDPVETTADVMVKDTGTQEDMLNLTTLEDNKCYFPVHEKDGTDGTKIGNWGPFLIYDTYDVLLDNATEGKSVIVKIFLTDQYL